MQLERHYALWREQIAWSTSSSTDNLTSFPDYHAIVAEGRCALPFVFEKIAEGDFLMNRAAHRITGVDVWAPVIDEWRREFAECGRPRGAQATSKLWLAWWTENRDKAEWLPRR